MVFGTVDDLRVLHKEVDRRIRLGIEVMGATRGYRGYVIKTPMQSTWDRITDLPFWVQETDLTRWRRSISISMCSNLGTV